MTGAREILAGSDDVLTIEWTVWLANKKAGWYEFDGHAARGYAPDMPPRNSTALQVASAGG